MIIKLLAIMAPKLYNVPMTIKSVSRENIQEILEALGLKSFTRPFSGLIDTGDFGTVGTYLPINESEYKKLSADLRQYVWPIAQGRYGIICFLPRTFEAIDGGKVVKVSISFSGGKMSKVEYVTDLGGNFEIEHPLRQEKLLTYAKNKKLLDDKTKKALSELNKKSAAKAGTASKTKTAAKKKTAAKSKAKTSSKSGTAAKAKAAPKKTAAKKAAK